MNAPNRFLWHSIDAATPPSRKRTGWGGALAVVSAVVVISLVLIRMEAAWGWVQ